MMIKYVAFLRGINVGTTKRIKMDALARIFASAGLRNVKTYIASGNVIFETSESDLSALRTKIEKKLFKSTGYKVPVLIRTLDHLEALLRRNPFRKIKPGSEVMLFVTFLSPGADQPKLPLKSLPEHLEVFASAEGAVFILARRKSNGWFGFPNNFIEKEFGAAATTRTWSTVGKIVALAKVKSPSA